MLSTKIALRTSTFVKSLKGHIQKGVYGDEVSNKGDWEALIEISVRLDCLS